MNSIRLDRITLPKIGLDRISLPRFGVPESEGSAALPSELKESLVCWYSPRKQGLTEYDVIESYATDFTTYSYRSTVATHTVLNNKITITNSLIASWFVAITPSKSVSFKAIVRGVGDVYIRYSYRDLYGNLKTIIINKDGVYDFPKSYGGDANFSTFGIGECNITITQLPTSTAKDYSGNGHDLHLYGFQGKLNSGIGVYKEDFTTWITGDVVEKTPFTVKKRFHSSSGGDRYVLVLKSNVSIEPFKVRVSITGTHASDRAKYVYIAENGDIEVLFINNGEEAVVPKSYAISDSSTYIGFQFTESGEDDCEVTITQIPDYPNQLCHSGKEYGVAYDMPILTDYTVITKRTWFEQNEFCVFSSKSLDSLNGAFSLEFIHNGRKMIKSFGAENYMDFSEDEIIYLSKNKYNGVDINSNSVQDYNELTIGRVNRNVNINYVGCWSDYLLFDRTLTDEEINYVKYNMIDTTPAPRPDVYYDLSKKNNDSPTRNIIEDLSGNGRNAEIFNMAYALGSGYGKYVTNFNEWRYRTYLQDVSPNSFTSNDGQHYSQIFVPNNNKDIPSFRVNMKTIKGNRYYIYRYTNEAGEIKTLNLKDDGIYTLPKNHVSLLYQNDLGFISSGNGICSITQLPSECEGALVFDGIDDYVQIGNGNLIKPFKTLFMEVVPFDMNKILYDQRMDVTERGFAILLENNVTAYNGRNSGKTYINGKFNDTLKANDLLNKHQVITIVNPTHPERSKIFIGSNFTGTNFYANMALYKLIGFYEELTPEEIKKVIYKYKLNYEKL